MRDIEDPFPSIQDPLYQEVDSNNKHQDRSDFVNELSPFQPSDIRQLGYEKQNGNGSESETEHNQDSRDKTVPYMVCPYPFSGSGDQGGVDQAARQEAQEETGWKI